MRVLAAPTFEQSALILAWAAILLLALALSGLMRQVDALTRTRTQHGGSHRAVGPATGMVAPQIPGLRGDSRSLLLFVDRGCPSCDQALGALAATAGNGEVIRAALYRGDPPPPAHDALLTVGHAEPIFSALGVTVTPTAVALDEQRQVIASAPAGTPALINQFLAYVSRAQEAPQ
jgi:hypothetical protein